MPTAFLAPPARQEHTGPDQLLQLSKIPVAGSSQRLLSNKKTLVSQQDMTRQTALPLAPVTIPSKHLTKVITPLTKPEDSSSESGASWSTPSSSGASSYQPSSSSSRREEEADDVINAQAGQSAAAKQAREFTKVLDRCAKPSKPAFTAGKPPAYQAKSTALQLPAATSKGIAEMVQVCPNLPNSISNSLVVDYVVCFMPQSFCCNAPSLQYILHTFAGLLCSSCLPVHSFSTHALLQGKQGADEAEGPAAPAAKRQRTGKAILNVSSSQHLLATNIITWTPSQTIDTSKLLFISHESMRWA